MGKLNETNAELTGDDVLNLGDRVKDKLSAATGTVVVIAFYLYAPPRVGVSLDSEDPSKEPVLGWFEGERLERPKT